MTAPVEEPAAPAVVVVEQAPAYVTAGELDARLSEMETRLGQQIGEARSTAWQAEDAALTAQGTAEGAALTAEVAVEVAVEAAETAEDAVEAADATGGDSGAGEEPTAPERRAEPAHDPEQDEEEKPAYGNPKFYGPGRK